MSFNCGHVISEHNGGETIVSNLNQYVKIVIQV